MSDGYYTFPGEIHKKIFSARESAVLTYFYPKGLNGGRGLKSSQTKIVVELKGLDSYSWSGLRTVVKGCICRHE